MKSKSGVSLVTVLLFMLVATIAGTATFKWLTSENFSSATRLRVAQARTAAMSGIEAARSWMSNNANDAGAALTQYITDKKPISLDQVLGTDLPGGRNYSVKIAGVDAPSASSTYRVKVVSVGDDGKGTTYTEAAILKVTGLYKVQVPIEKKAMEFHHSYYGGTTGSTDGVKSESMIINGDWSGNPTGVSKDFVVTGNVTLSGNNISFAQNNCIGGNLKAENAGASGGNLYVEKNAGPFTGEYTGNVYFNGNVNLNSNNPGLTVGGNMTLNGTLNHPSMQKTKIKGNMCLTNSGKVNLGTLSSQNEFRAEGNIWIPDENGLIGSKQVNNRGWVTLGADGAELFIKGGAKCNGKYEISEHGNLHQSPTSTYCYKDGFKDIASKANLAACPENMGFQKRNVTNYSVYYGCSCENNCKINGSESACTQTCASTGVGSYTENFSLFTTKGTISNDVDGEPEFECAQSIKNYCDDIWTENTSSCNHGNKYMVPEMLTTAYDVFSEYANKSTCAVSLLTADVDTKKKSATELSTCYQKALEMNGGSGILYNDYMVVKGSASNFSGMFPQQGEGVLTGKFIFIVEGEGLDAKLPVTGNDSYVMFYLPDGAGTIATTNDVGSRNYFFYALKDIKTLMHNAPNNADRVWNGSFYFPQNSCAGIGNMTMAEQRLKVNEDLLKDLNTNNILCDASVSSCGGARGSGGGSEVVDGRTSDGYDVNFVAISSQISVISESQYRSKESFDEAVTLKPSALVMPRVIYLNKDPSGKLSDYYGVINLNGARLTGNGEVSCEGGIPTSGKLFDGTNPLREGTFVCSYQETAQNVLFKSFFYVNVSGTTAENPAVSFVGSASEQYTSLDGHEINVFMQIEGSNGTPHQFSVDIARSNDDVNWEIDDGVNSSLVKRTGSSGMTVYTYTGVTTENTQKIKLFTIKTSSISNSGAVTFTLQTPEGCTIVFPFYKQIQIQGISTVNRHELKEYCEKYKSSPECTEENLKRPSCAEKVKGVWAVAHASEKTCNADPGKPNDSWSCFTDPAVTLMRTSAANVVPDYCSVVIPAEDNTVALNSNEQVYVLYGSVLAKRYTLNVEVRGAEDGGYVRVCKEGETVCEKCSSENCSYGVYGGERYVLTAAGVSENGDVFDYWACSTKDCVDDPIKSMENKLIITGDNSTTAVFNQKDEHCFYDKFSPESVQFCSDDSEKKCVKQCLNAKGVPCGIVGKTDWIMSYRNGLNDKKDNEPLSYDGAGYIYTTNTKNPNSANGSSTLLLRNVLAGTSGVMNALFHTMVDVGSNDFLNSGFILRSDDHAGKYLMLNIYGNTQGHLTGRLCIGVGHGITNSSSGKCSEGQFVSDDESGNPVTISNTTMVKAKISVSANAIDVETTTDDVVAKLKFSLSEPKYKEFVGNSDYSYVGIALSDPVFHLFDVGWASETYNKSCFETPQLMCSFKANYLGGLVPLAENVTPWVGASSWYSEKNCSYEFLYSGNDNSTSQSWFFAPMGFDRKVPDGTYNFSEAGLHGPGVFTGWPMNVPKEAKVKVTCLLNGQEVSSYAENVVSCGSFMVGDVQTCYANETLVSTSQTSLNGSAVEATFDSKNLRGSDLVVSVSQARAGAVINVMLTDAAGISTTTQVSGSGRHRINLDNISNVDGFDPQQVVKLSMSSQETFTVDGVQSVCSNVMSMSCENSSVSYVNGVWQFALDAQNAEECSVKPAPNSNSAINELKTSCVAGNDGKVHIAVEENLGTLYSSTEYAFTVTSNAANQESQFCTLTAYVEPSGSSSNDDPSPTVDCDNVLNCTWGDEVEIELGESITFYSDVAGVGNCDEAELVRIESHATIETGCVYSKVIKPTSIGLHTYEYRGVTASACREEPYSCKKVVNVVPKNGGGSSSGSGPETDAYVITEKNTAIEIPAGRNSVTINRDGSVSGCQFSCRAESKGLNMKIGSSSFSGDYYVGGNVDASVCQGTSTVELSVPMKCSADWW